MKLLDSTAKIIEVMARRFNVDTLTTINSEEVWHRGYRRGVEECYKAMLEYARQHARTAPLFGKPYRVVKMLTLEDFARGEGQKSEGAI